MTLTKERMEELKVLAIELKDSSSQYVIQLNPSELLALFSMIEKKDEALAPFVEEIELRDADAMLRARSNLPTEES